MGRPPSIPVEKKTRIVLSVLAGEVSVAEAARREKVSEQSIGRWKADFLEAGKTALAAGKSGPSSREEQLEAEVAELTGPRRGRSRDPGVEEERGGQVGPFEDLEVIRVKAACDREVLRRLRHPRAVVAALAGQGQGRPPVEGSLAAARSAGGIAALKMKSWRPSSVTSSRTMSVTRIRRPGPTRPSSRALLLGPAPFGDRAALSQGICARSPCNHEMVLN